MYKIDLAYNSLKCYILDIKVLEVLLQYVPKLSFLLIQAEIYFNDIFF